MFFDLTRIFFFFQYSPLSIIARLNSVCVARPRFFIRCSACVICPMCCSFSTLLVLMLLSFVYPLIYISLVMFESLCLSPLFWYLCLFYSVFPYSSCMFPTPISRSPSCFVPPSPNFLLCLLPAVHVFRVAPIMFCTLFVLKSCPFCLYVFSFFCVWVLLLQFSSLSIVHCSMCCFPCLLVVAAGVNPVVF